MPNPPPVTPSPRRFLRPQAAPRSTAGASSNLRHEHPQPGAHPSSNAFRPSAVATAAAAAAATAPYSTFTKPETRQRPAPTTSSSTQFAHTPRFSFGSVSRSANDAAQDAAETRRRAASDAFEAPQWISRPHSWGSVRKLKRVDSIEDTWRSEDEDEEMQGINSDQNPEDQDHSHEKDSLPNDEDSYMLYDHDAEPTAQNEAHIDNVRQSIEPCSIQQGEEEQEEQDILSSPPFKRPRLGRHWTPPPNPTSDDSNRPSSVVKSPRRFLPPTAFGPGSRGATAPISPPSAVTPARPSFRLPTHLSPTKALANSNPLPEAFSPHKKGQKFIPGGMADTLRGWIVGTVASASAAASTGPYRAAVDTQWSTTIRISQVVGYHNIHDDDTHSAPRGGERMTLARGDVIGRGIQDEMQEINVMLAPRKGVRRPRPGDVVGLQTPYWEVQANLKEEQGMKWLVGVDWGLLPEA